ncbi:hypothetical protein PM082_003691 [Marasmius tenuissimus]|nr:hypothetical protein PM082_003691 [Marasmius tenuissimus]
MDVALRCRGRRDKLLRIGPDLPDCWAVKERESGRIPRFPSSFCVRDSLDASKGGIHASLRSPSNSCSMVPSNSLSRS